MLRGLDASSIQGLLPFHSLKDYAFVILKAQQGNDGFDAFFERNMLAGLAKGIEVFAYCFAYPLPKLDPKEQAKLFVDRVYAHHEMIGRPIFLDFEWPAVQDWAKWGCNATQIADWLRVHCEEIHRLSGVRPVLYTYPYWWAAVSKGDVAWASAYPLWQASYIDHWPTEGESPRVLAPWLTWTFWQFDGNKGVILPNGIDIDANVFNGTLTDLRALCSVSIPRPTPEDWSIAAIQKRLSDLGLYRGRIDGVFGSKTLAAVKAFQQMKGLVVDGIVGPLTKAAFG